MEIWLPKHDEELGEDCPHCGNPKSLGACAVCAGELQRHNYKSELQQRREQTSKPINTRLKKEKPDEIPNDSEGRPVYGIGSKSYEDTKRRLLGKKTA